MRIDAIHLTSFRAYADAMISPLSPQVNFFAGENGVGKSSIREAVAVALTGTYQDNPTGRQLGDLRRDGARKRWQVDLETDVGPFSRAEGEGPQSAAQARIDAALRLPRHQVRACLYADGLLGADDNVAQKILLELASPEIQLGDELAGLLVKHMKVTRTTAPLSALDAWYKVAYDKRTETKRLAKAITPYLPALPDDLDDTVAEMDLEQLAEASTNLKHLIRSLKTERDKIESEVARVQAEIPRLRARLAEIDEEHEEPLDLDALLAAKEKAEATLKSAEAASERLKSDLQTARGNLEESRRRLNEMREQTRRVIAMGDGCPTCRRPFKPKELEDILVPLRQREQDQAKLVDADEQNLADCQKRFDAGPDVTELRRARDEAGAKYAYAGEAETRNSKRVQERSEITIQLAELEQYDVEQATNYLNSHKSRIAVGEQRVLNLAAYAEARSLYESATKRMARVNKDVEELELMCHLLGPDGVRTTVASDAIVDFTRKVNRILRPQGFVADFSAAAARAGCVLINGRPARLLSSSEDVRVGLAVQAAVARTIGLDLVFLDDSDRCVGPALVGLWNAIRQLEGVQTFVFSSARNFDSFRETGAHKLAEATGWNVFAVVSGEGGSRVDLLAAGAS